MAASEPAATTQPAPPPGDGESVSMETSSFPGFSFDAPTLTSDGFGHGPALREAGIGAHYFWNSQFMSGFDGGETTGSLKHSATYDLFLTFDFERMGLIDGADMLLHARQQWGASINPWTGADQQINDDADGDRSLYVDQLWYRHQFLDRVFTLQIGYLDYQTIVDRNVYANSEDKQFMNAALDNNPLIPTASMAGLGAAMTFRPCDGYSLIVGAGDAQRLPLYKPGFSTTFHGEAWFLGYMEHGLHPRIPTSRGGLPGNYRFGMVYDPLPRDVFTRPRERARRRGNDVGLYLSFDQMLFRESDMDAQGLGAFARFAYRHEDVHRFNRFGSAGLTYTGLIPTRDRDVLGIAVAHLVGSDRYRTRMDTDAGDETIYELYYAMHIAPWLVISPDFQYINNPGDTDRVAHAVVAGLRIRITF